jgi:hypothetical protein
MHDILAAGLKQQTFRQYDEKKLTNNISDKKGGFRTDIQIDILTEVKLKVMDGGS